VIAGFFGIHEQIVMKWMVLLLGMSAFSAQAQMYLRGKVVETDGQSPLPGVSVRVQNELIGTYTRSDGSYEIGPLKEGEYFLEFKYLGMRTMYQQYVAGGENDFLIRMVSDPFQIDGITVEGSRASERAPYAKTEVDKEELEKINLAQDMPILLNQLTSVVTTSDAGAGVGYTGIRIRGSDASRINVTINGIPLNDSESQGVFWVNLPDFASSTESIQVQRGVGSSTNGSGAFGATVNLQSDQLRRKAYGQIGNSFGSFNTRKHTLKFGTGLINNRFAIDARLSNIHTDGYIDRARADLRSYYFSAGYYGEKDVVRFITFAGLEETYQSWWGTPQSRIENDAVGIENHILNNGLSPEQADNLRNSGRTYNYYEYDNQVDHYQQDHYQLHWSHSFNSRLRWQNSAHFTYGRGYFEEYKDGEDFSDYGLQPVIFSNDTVISADLIRRRWLDNDFFGIVSNLNWRRGGNEFIFGLNAHQYEGDHFGEIIWSEFASNSNIRQRYYNSRSYKTDLSGFAKWEGSVSSDLFLFADLQLRSVDYRSRGNDNDLRAISVDTAMLFFNPKFGARYLLNDLSSIYFSYSRGSREPTRNDFIDALAGQQPTPEILNDFEAGWQLNRQKLSLEANLYYMYYSNQLVLTGELNDVGSPIRTNVDRSYRAGIELNGRYQLRKELQLEGNVSLSQNKIAEFNEILYDYTNGFDVIVNSFQNTDISFSPNAIAFAGLNYQFLKNAGFNLRWKYVGAQYLDNTSNKDRSIEAYNTLDALLFCDFNKANRFDARLKLLVNNLLNMDYSSNGYTYSYVYGSQVTENFYYPQAGINFLVGLDFSF
jgi:iron complex outermembrane receptor protein